MQPTIRSGTTLNSVDSSTSLSLIRRARLADKPAWEKLTRLYGPVVYNWARQAGLQPDDAADVMQDVFHVLTTQLVRFQRRTANDSFRGWLYTITKNKICDRYRSLQKDAQPLGGTVGLDIWQQLPDAPHDESTQAGKEELSGIRHRALDLISGQFAAQTWQAFFRTAIQGDLPQDVADDLGVSVWAVYKARTRVLTKLRAEFQDLLT